MNWANSIVETIYKVVFNIERKLGTTKPKIIIITIDYYATNELNRTLWTKIDS